MGTMEKNVTDEVREANRANSTASTGPTSEAGKKRSSMNAVKHGKYAKRLDPVKRLLQDLSEEEEAEREALRTDMVERCQPPDAFAEQQAEELADLQFELRRLEGVKQVIWQRERELLELEQRKRALRLNEDAVEPRYKEVCSRGLASQPDSPGKLREILRILELLTHPDLEVNDAWAFVERVYGGADRSWRGTRLRWALSRVDEAKSDEDRQRAIQDFEREAQRELEYVREELAICELEQGPLSEAGQAARLLEVMSSRKWSWIRHQENSLMRSIDRKVRVLMDLKREGEADAKHAKKSGSGENPSGGNPPETAGSNGRPGPTEISDEAARAGSSTEAEHGLEARATCHGRPFAALRAGFGHVVNLPTSGSSAGGEKTEAVSPAAVPASAAGVPSAALLPEKIGQNQGTKPTSGLFSATAWDGFETDMFEVTFVYGDPRQIETIEGDAITFLASDPMLLN